MLSEGKVTGSARCNALTNSRTGSPAAPTGSPELDARSAAKLGRTFLSRTAPGLCDRWRMGSPGPAPGCATRYGALLAAPAGDPERELRPGAAQRRQPQAVAVPNGFRQTRPTARNTPGPAPGAPETMILRARAHQQQSSTAPGRAGYRHLFHAAVPDQ